MQNVTKALCLALSTALLSGCLAGMGTKSDTPANQNTADQNRTKTEATLLGGALGAAVGYAAGGDEKSALIGAAVGAGAGYLVGDLVAERKKQYANREEAIAKETTRATQFVQETQKTNSQLKKDISAYKKQITKLKADVKKGKATQADMEQQKTLLTTRQTEAKKGLEAVQSELQVANQLYADYKQEGGGKESDMKNWKSKIAKLEKEKSTLQASIDDLTAMNSSI